MYDDVESDIKKMKHPNTISGHKFQMNLLKGLMKNTDDVYVLNTSRVRFYPHYPEKIIGEKDFWVNGKSVGKSVKFINLLGIHYLSRYAAITNQLQKYICELKDEKCFIICFNGFLPVQLSILKCKRKNKNIYTCSVIGDIHGKYGIINSDSTNFFKIKVIQFIGILADKLTRKFDCFAFLTRDMAYALNVENKPFVVIEGMFDASEINCGDIDTVVETNLKIIFYAGSLSEEYGILHLIRAFEMIDGAEYRLCLAGKGNTEKYIKEYSASDNRIKYLGFITPQEVYKWQRKATVLISPRTSENHEYVKYSFPSKAIESLASGKPYIAHKLPCDPPEYEKYIQYADDETDEALTRKIIEICSLSELERNEIGCASKKFIENEKNPMVMTKKIIDMCKAMTDDK